ncbi:MAG: cysteine desulfurase NifS [Deltaproteobacteria bacterium]|jgi:cysteine desulfurase|nr:cysteine desulfurase NifS [Deltaproteobacteria bacterium]
MRVIYLDNNATTMVAPEVVEVMLPYFTDRYGNASSMHSFGGQLDKAMLHAREQTAQLIGASPDEIVYTSCGTESDSTAIMAALQTQPEKRHIVTTAVEHPAIVTLCQHLETRGYDVTLLGVDEQGRLNLDELASSLRRDTAIVSIMSANNETGTMFPMQRIADIVKERGILLHTDAVQTVGKESINLATLPVDYLSLSGHKLHAPKGIGVLYVRKGARFRPFLRGGHQEHSRRAGTENVPYIIGLGRAAELICRTMDADTLLMRRLRDKLEQNLLTIADTRVNGDPEHRLPNTSNVSFKFIEGEAILLHMDRHGICASSGSACTSGSLEPSHVLRAMNVPFTFVHGSIRFSLSRYTTEADIDDTLAVMPSIISSLRAISPFRK